MRLFNIIPIIFFLSFCTISNLDAQISNFFQDGSSTVDKYSKFQVRIQLTNAETNQLVNPYDPDEVRMEVVFTHNSSGKESVSDVFYSLKYDRITQAPYLESDK